LTATDTAGLGGQQLAIGRVLALARRGPTGDVTGGERLRQVGDRPAGLEHRGPPSSPARSSTGRYGLSAWRACSSDTPSYGLERRRLAAADEPVARVEEQLEHRARLQRAERRPQRLGEPQRPGFDRDLHYDRRMPADSRMQNTSCRTPVWASTPLSVGPSACVRTVPTA
jgi:hypothetical protein